MKYLLPILLVVFVSCRVTKPGGVTPKPVDTVIIKPNPGDPLVKPKDTLLFKPIPKETDTTKAAYHINKIFEGLPAVLNITNGVQTILLDLKEDFDNYEYLQAVIDRVPADERVAYSVGKGKFFFSNTIKIKNKSVWIIGTNGTEFIFPKSVTGIQITRDHYIYPCLLQNINIIAQDNSDTLANGVEVSSITHMFNVNVYRFGGNGFSYVADIGANKGDISKAFHINCEAVQVGKDGFLYRGGDANAVSNISSSARDNGGFGFNDQSFLGNYFFGAMAHENKKGHYKSGDHNNANVRTVWAACYGEGQAAPSQAWGASKIFGGINASQWELHHWATADVK